MVDAVFSATVRQLRRTASCCSPRSLPIRREELHRGLHNADFPGTRSGIVTQKEWSRYGNDPATATSRSRARTPATNHGGRRRRFSQSGALGRQTAKTSAGAPRGLSRGFLLDSGLWRLQDRCHNDSIPSGLRCRSWFRGSLHYVVPGGALHAVLVRIVVNNRMLSAEVVERWRRRRRRPFERGTLPRVRRSLRTLKAAVS